MKVPLLEKFVEVPKDVKAKVEKNIVEIEGKLGVNKREFKGIGKVKIELKDNKIRIYAEKATKKEKKIINTIAAHIKNMIKGVNEKFVYKLKICSQHFPMNVSIQGKELIVKNFLGEKKPRILKIKDNVDVKIQGEIIIVESINKELAGQTAADIENLTRITGRDRRIFTDGIWIINKAGKEV